MTCYLGVDIGTTNIKALAFDPDNSRIVAHATTPLTTLFPAPGHCEQDPDEIWVAFTRVIDEVCHEVQMQQGRIEAVCFSSAMHSTMAVDSQGLPLNQFVIWSDNRAEEQVTALRQHPEQLRDLYQHTGIPAHPMTPFCKLLWFREHQPDLLRKAHRWISLKEFIWYRLTGRFEIDYSIATATGLFDGNGLTWYGPALELAGLRSDQLSGPVPTTHSVTYKSASAPFSTALPDGVRLIAGASDGCLANLGAGAMQPGITTITIGTSGAIRQTVHQPLRDDEQRLFCYILDVDSPSEETRSTPCYIVGGPTNNGANVLQWLSEKLTRQDVTSVLADASHVPPGSAGLLFLPYLQGERAPLWNAHARGAYLHVGWEHSRAHFVRAALEGVLFNLYAIEELLDRHTGDTTIIHANGGFAQSTLWVQMMADIFGVPVRLNDSNESGSMGAILLALKATGRVSSLEEATRYVGFGPTFEPDAGRHAVYRETYERFRKAMQNLRQ